MFGGKGFEKKYGYPPPPLKKKFPPGHHRRSLPPQVKFFWGGRRVFTTFLKIVNNPPGSRSSIGAPSKKYGRSGIKFLPGYHRRWWPPQVKIFFQLIISCLFFLDFILVICLALFIHLLKKDE